MDLRRLVITRPSGNETAIVFDEIASEFMRETGAVIQNEYPSVEQVIFVEKRAGGIHGQMAGGEFCGNAARSLGYVLANGEGTQTFSMSGLSTPVTVQATPNRTTLKMQTRLIQQEEKSLGGAPFHVVHLEGISHALMLPEHKLFDLLKEYAARPDRWNTVTHVLDDLGLMAKPACGLILVENKNESVSITPYVFVRDIQTLYAETACASGSIATACFLGKNLSIQQPSGESLDVKLRCEGEVAYIEIGGSMAVKYDGPALGLQELSETKEVAKLAGE